MKRHQQYKSSSRTMPLQGKSSSRTMSTEEQIKRVSEPSAMIAQENQQFADAKTKAQISCAVTAQLISAFVFATRIVQFLFFIIVTDWKFESYDVNILSYCIVGLG